MSAPANEAEAIKAAAQAWYERELERAAVGQGKYWPEHRAWVEGYVQEELRQRLVAGGWHD